MSSEVAAYLSERLEAEVVVTELHRTFPGMSRETWMVDAEVAGAPRRLVLRVESVGAETPFPLRREWDLYTRLWAAAVPVPEPLWFDPSPPIFEGRSLMARALVDGSPRPAVAAADAARRHVRQLAEVHLLDWDGLGFGAVLEAPPADDPYAVELRTWTAVWEAGRTDPFPIVTEVLHWLAERRPRAAPRISLLKGNNGIGEEIWRDGEVVALVDWELAALGDPALDLAFSQGLLAEDPDGVLSTYAAATGDDLDEDRLAFAGLWVTFKSLCCLNACGLRSHLDGRGRRSHRVNLGLGVAKNFERILGGVVGQDVVAAYRDLAPQLPGNGYLAGVRKR